MNIRNDIKQFVLATALLVPGLVHAAVILPGLDIVEMGSDSGATVTNSSFSIEATAFQIVFDDSSLNIDITDEAFILTSNTGSYTPAGGFGSGSFGGTFTVGVDGGLLAGTFDALQVSGLGENLYNFNSDLVFTSGSLMGGFYGGRIEGAIIGSTLQAKLGEVTVVPVPAAVWLFGSGLLGLVGVARRKIS